MKPPVFQGIPNGFRIASPPKVKFKSHPHIPQGSPNRSRALWRAPGAANRPSHVSQDSPASENGVTAISPPHGFGANLILLLLSSKQAPSHNSVPVTVLYAHAYVHAYVHKHTHEHTLVPFSRRKKGPTAEHETLCGGSMCDQARYRSSHSVTGPLCRARRYMYRSSWLCSFRSIIWDRISI